MDALELLKSDHDRVKALFKEIQATRDFKLKVQLFHRIRDELTLHSHLEETVFYPAFKPYDDLKGILERSYDEHQTVKNLLRDIQDKSLDARAEADVDQFDNQIHSLIENVEHHVEEEEGELFSQVRKIMRRPERERLGRHMQASKDESQAAA